VAETQYLLDIAKRSRGVVKGVVGWVDLGAADAIPTLTRLARNPLLFSLEQLAFLDHIHHAASRVADGGTRNKLLQRIHVDRIAIGQIEQLDGIKIRMGEQGLAQCVGLLELALNG
jgi:hypothetical protein